MKFLDRPTIPDSPRDIFIKCINGYKGKCGDDKSVRKAERKRKRLTKCADTVAVSAALYEDAIPAKPFSEPALPARVKAKELAGVYKEKFSAESSPGRVYYDLIRGSAHCAQCPICGEKGDNQLDHYLPESKYPTLCVNPLNLMPICDTCNKKKQDQEYSAEEGRPLHLYLDRLPMKKDVFGDFYMERFLYAKLDSEFAATFYVQCPPDWDETLTKRLNNHMAIYELADRYRSYVPNAYSNISSLLRENAKELVKQREPDEKKQVQLLDELLRSDERITLLEDIIASKAEDAVKIDINSWESALYHAIRPKIAAFAQWLFNSDISPSK